MKDIGFVGLGVLGYVLATAMSIKGHRVIGYDIRPEVMNRNPRPFKEKGFSDDQDRWALESGGKPPIGTIAPQAENRYDRPCSAP